MLYSSKSGSTIWLAAIATTLAASVSATLQILPGATWTATNTGQHIQAHGGSITKVGNTYYLIGENKQDGSAFQSVRCYSSTNLVEWTFVNSLLTRQSSGDLGPSRVVERPKVIYNSATSRWVMYLHIDSSNYGEAKVGVATSTNGICGSYTYIRSWRPLGYESRDMGLYQDTDGSGYLLTEDRANGLRIDRLSSDYLDVVSNVYTWPEKYESPAVIKKDGVYFMFGSQLTGWDTNDNIYSTATSLSGPWSAWKNFAPSGTRTHDSQTTFILQVGSNYMFMGDRWFSANLMRSSYIWLPITINSSARTASLPTNYINWIIDPNTGASSAGPSETWYEGESGVFTGNAKSGACSGCSGTKSAGYIGPDGSGSLRWSNVSSQASTRTTIRIKHQNGDTTQRFADINVNGATQRIAFLPTTDGNTPGTASLHVQLNSGSNNVVTITGANGGYAADIDRIAVPAS